jgi:hypothetical protein
MIWLLLVLAAAGAWPAMTKGPLWAGFLVGLPLLLAGLLLAGRRWAFMAAVMYGTIGLALDIATIVQELTHPAAGGSLPASLASGLLNFVLILAGGRGFFDADPAPAP